MSLLVWRASFLVWSGVHLFGLITSIIFFKIIYLHVNTIGSWTQYEVLALVGFMELTFAIGELTFFPMCWEFGDVIRKGDLDRKLTKPLDIQFQVSIPYCDLTDALSLVTGFVVLFYAAAHLPISLASVSIFVIMLISSMLLTYSLLILFASLVFYTTTLELENMFWTFRNLGAYPVSVYKEPFRFLLTFILPIGLMFSFPIRVLVGEIDYLIMVYILILTIFLFLLSRKVFMKSLRNYSSASS